MVNLYALSFEELSEFLADLGAKRYRARQLWNWLYARRVESFDAMTDLPRDR